MGSVLSLGGHGWLRQGLHAHRPECQVEELEVFVLVAKPSCGKFQKEGETGMNM